MFKLRKYYNDLPDSPNWLHIFFFFFKDYTSEDSIEGPPCLPPQPRQLSVSLSFSEETITLRSVWMIPTHIFRLLSFVFGSISNGLTESLP